MCIASNDAYAIGICHHLGLGTPKDNIKALIHLETAAKSGNELAQYELAGLFYQTRNEMSFMWYLRAAKQGLFEAQYVIGRLLYTGTGCVENVDDAIIWFKKAAKQGSIHAKNYIQAIEKQRQLNNNNK